MPKTKDRRTKIKRWIGPVVVAILVGAVIFVGVRMTYMQAKLIESLQSNFELLSTQYEKFQGDYDLLYSKYTELSSDYESLESDFETFDTDYKMLQGRVSELQNNSDKLEQANNELRQLLAAYERVPHDYYSVEKFAPHNNVYRQLENFLKFEFALPRGYELEVFDCSESSAYLEWALENAGFDAAIALGPTPWSPSSGTHAWVIVNTKDEEVAIEATALTGEYQFSRIFTVLVPTRTPGVVYQGDPQIPGWQNYYQGYDYLYKNIFEAYLSDVVSCEQWNWWEGFWGFK